jgi:hypothetical protein
VTEHKANTASEVEENLDEAARVSEGGYQVYPGANLLHERDRRSQQLTSELQNLDLEIKASEGYPIHTRITFLEESYFIFDGNYLNLKHILDEFEQPTIFLKLLDERDRGRLTLFIRDVIRLFHNYLAGAATLLDHTRVLKDDMYEETSFADEYRQEVDQRFKNSSLPHFVEDLRNYMLHMGLPFALSKLTFDRGSSGMEVDSVICLDVSKLRAWKEWSEKGLEYLSTLDDEVKLDDIVNEYRSTVAGFYTWFRERQSELHHEALEKLEELESKREQLQQELRDIEDPLELTEETVSAMQEERQRLMDELASERRKYEQLEKEHLQVRQDIQQLIAEQTKGFWGRLAGSG